MDRNAKQAEAMIRQVEAMILAGSKGNAAIIGEAMVAGADAGHALQNPDRTEGERQAFMEGVRFGLWVGRPGAKWAE